MCNCSMKNENGVPVEYLSFGLGIHIRKHYVNSIIGPNVKGFNYSRVAELMQQPDFIKNVENDYSEGKYQTQKIKMQIFEHYFLAVLCPKDYAALSIF